MKRGYMVLPNGQLITGKAPKNMKNADRYARKMMGKKIDLNKTIMQENKHQEKLSPEVVDMLSK